MSWTLLRIVTVCLAFLFAVLPAQAADLGSLDGTWEGNLGSIEGSTIPIRPYAVRIVIRGTNADVFARDRSGGSFQELKPGKFRVAQLGPNGIVAAIDSGRDDEGTWVETWNFTVTLKQKETLIVNLCRTVNNVDLPLSVAHSKFVELQTGELSRVR